LSNLIVLDSPGIGIILGMDWLKKYDRVIHYVKRAVQLVGANGTKVEFVAAPSTWMAVSLNATKAIPMEEIKVVHDFLDVFPDDPAGMPLDRDIEFIIYLVPGTAPISKRLYRMPANELAELKKQLAELQKNLLIARCTEREKVVFAAHQLDGPAADWRDAYSASHPDAETITWTEFKDSFRAHFIPAGHIELTK
jgi:hypothetical protein